MKKKGRGKGRASARSRLDKEMRSAALECAVQLWQRSEQIGHAADVDSIEITGDAKI